MLLVGIANAEDPGYRVVLSPVLADHNQTSFPPASQQWELRYVFVVPPLPRLGSWDPKGQVFYIWGDVDFDVYGAGGQRTMSRYLYNQITPQLMIGNALAKNDSSYSPSWVVYDHWVVQAQYYWQSQEGVSYGQTGEAVSVHPGDIATTSIKYDPSRGEIFASISSSEGTSAITIPRPFPNEREPLFSSWRDFFEQAQAKTGHLFGQAVVNVESHYLNQDTMCSVLPLNIKYMSGPGFPAAGPNFKVAIEGSFSCPTGLAKFDY